MPVTVSSGMTVWCGTGIVLVVIPETVPVGRMGKAVEGDACTVRAGTLTTVGCAVRTSRFNTVNPVRINSTPTTKTAAMRKAGVNGRNPLSRTGNARGCLSSMFDEAALRVETGSAMLDALTRRGAA